jgi:hypothetical protein
MTNNPERFLIQSCNAFSDIEVGVGWTHVKVVGPREWLYLSQANGPGTGDDVFTFNVKVSRTGHVRVRFIERTPAFQ